MLHFHLLYYSKICFLSYISAGGKCPPQEFSLTCLWSKSYSEVEDIIINCLECGSSFPVVCKSVNNLGFLQTLTFVDLRKYNVCFVFLNLLSVTSCVFCVFAFLFQGTDTIIGPVQSLAAEKPTKKKKKDPSSASSGCL